MSIKEFKFGKYTLNIYPLKKCAGNAYFNKPKQPTDDYQKASELISKTLSKDYHDQNGMGKRVWSALVDDDIRLLELLEKNYRYGVN